MEEMCSGNSVPLECVEQPNHFKVYCNDGGVKVSLLLHPIRMTLLSGLRNIGSIAAMR